MQRSMFLQIVLTAAVALACGMFCTADEGGFFGKRRPSGGPPCHCPASPSCPDDYCRKPLPAVPCPSNGCAAECFARKPLPCPPCGAGSVTCDDYISKCLPQERCPFRPQFECADIYPPAPWYRNSASRRTTTMPLALR